MLKEQLKLNKSIWTMGNLEPCNLPFQVVHENLETFMYLYLTAICKNIFSHIILWNILMIISNILIVRAILRNFIPKQFFLFKLALLVWKNWCFCTKNYLLKKIIYLWEDFQTSNCLLRQNLFFRKILGNVVRKK